MGRYGAEPTTAELLAAAEAYATATAGLANAIDYGTAEPAAAYMGNYRMTVTSESGNRVFTLSFERASGRYAVGTTINGGRTYLKGTLALMARDVFRAGHPAFA